MSPNEMRASVHKLPSNQLESKGCCCTYSVFTSSQGLQETFITLSPNQYGSFKEQLTELEEAFFEILAQLGLAPQNAIMKRFLCSDLTNQSLALAECEFSNPDLNCACAVSCVQQPPIAPAKVALQVHCLGQKHHDLQRDKQGKHLILHRGELSHYWTMGLAFTQSDHSFGQTIELFESYLGYLQQQGLTLADHVIRTWFYVKDVDSNYAGLVTARNEVFLQQGLTSQTHYIASTGIEGAHANPTCKVMLDAYAVKGIRPEQIRYLNALDYLGYTHDYGVAFERATEVSYAGRKHIFISGTASIDPKGQIVHPNDVALQLERVLQNINALLRQANATLTDLKQCTVYIRDSADGAFIQAQMSRALPQTPFVVVTAPVCRPGWLIEIEGIACVSHCAPHLPPF